MSNNSILTDKFLKALTYAGNIHRDQKRKGTQIPYISHLLSVASLVLENGGNEDEAIGALLHDAVEDQNIPLQEISDLYGAPVAKIVEDCTDSWENPKPDWKTRKEKYIESLLCKGKSSLLVSLADKVHNAESIAFDFDLIGDKIFDRFKGQKEGTIWYYSELSQNFSKLLSIPLADRLQKAVEIFSK